MLADPPSLPLAATHRTPSATSDNDLPIALCKASGVASWKMAMDEMSAHISRGTWELVEVPPNGDVVACQWVFTPKFWVDGTLEQYKEKKPHKVCKLKKAIFGLKQSPRAWFDKFNHITGEFGFSGCQDLRTSIVVLAIYVDDILITGSDVGIEEAKTYLWKLFVTKDLGGQSISWELKSLIASMGSLYVRENMLVISFKKKAY
ncbi:Retrovirus-related Pol polyprotein from transposon RE1 [Sesamum angolense]|uniref:Retrovirus-related Pol polyprotein from transposon RE1 n=1 Tax=Sesamum angolense TaxID=2727404 RepID=A0AAE2C0T5_9LAMI|nr:Retrovirus-related Pol polyprotein from transposon RE1 [Sesamum angolense]